ncbi:Basic region leucine zipper [Popillia japonica]|uniref:Basic region leucine zipper n=1 Tax=Popillia japonica TaxID=7064 RepID=A0AAW1JHA3_POPJA
MYNLNVNLATSAAPGAVNNLLMVETGGATPRTPEILNSLMAMTNPLDNYNFNDDCLKHGDKKPFTNTSSDSNSSSCSQLESPTNGPTSVQQTCSQLIKAGLKLSIEQKRKFQSDSEDILDLDKCPKRIKKNECSESEEDKHNNGGMYLQLTPEDEERRRRRRERNKIAATKCRLKKREKTANLVTESETLEAQNIELKTQITQLQNERRQILGILETHRSTCQNNVAPVTRDALYSHRLPPVTSVIETNHSYSRPASVDSINTYRSRQTPVSLFNRPASVGNEVSYSNTRQFAKMPTIIVESPTDSYHHAQLSDVLESSLQASYHQANSYNNQQCHNYANANSYNPGLDNGCMA